jgi:hypothetical protein
MKMSSRNNHTPPPTYLQAVMLDMVDAQTEQLQIHQHTTTCPNQHILVVAIPAEQQLPNVPPRTTSSQHYITNEQNSLHVPSVQTQGENAVGNWNRELPQNKCNAGRWSFGFFLIGAILLVIVILRKKIL